MARKPSLEKLEELFERGTDFELTDAQYEKYTGKMLPKEKWYLLNKSALAKKCAENGYRIVLIEKTVQFTKVK